MQISRMQISYLYLYCIVMIIIRHRRAMRKGFFLFSFFSVYSSQIDLHPNFVHKFMRVLWHLRKGFDVIREIERGRETHTRMCIHTLVRSMY